MLPMTFEIAIMLVLIAGALALFVSEILPIEVTALGLLAAVVVLGFVNPEQALSGFSNKAVVAIGSLFVLSHALTRTGLVETLTEALARRFSGSTGLGVGVILGAVAVLSGFLNNTAVVAMSIPLMMNISARFAISPSRILLPMSYASIFGGTLTLIGTSTNLLVSSVLEDGGQPGISMFEFTAMGSIFLVVGLGYVVFFAPRLLPDRAPHALTGKYGMGEYLTEVKVVEGCSLEGKTCAEAKLNERYSATVLSIVRGKSRIIRAAGTTALERDDILIVQGTVDDLLRLRREEGVALLSDVKLTDEELSTGGLVMVEGLVTPNSQMIGKTLQQIDFREHFGGFVLAIRRLSGTLHRKIAHTRLQAADSLLMLLPEDRLEEMIQTRGDDVVVISQLHHVHLHRARRWWLVLVLLPLAVALAAFGVVDIAISAMLAAIVLLVVRVLDPPEAYRSINWSVIFLIAAFVPVGHAIVETGTAGFIAERLLAVVTQFPPALVPYAALAMLYVMTSVLTQMISNTAAAIILTPIALSLGAALGIAPRPLVVAVCFAASAGFMTPMAYQTNLMVYGPGAYRFMDYVRFGTPLNILFCVLAVLLIPRFWGF